MGKKMWIVACALSLVLALCSSSHAWPIPDTGQTKCYNNTGEIPCPQPGEPFYGQDGNYTINPPSYTKLDANGNALPDSATSWVMVRDNVTGLIWENKTSDGSIHDGSKSFTWCDRNPATNGGNQGTCGTGAGEAATDTEAFIKALNSANFGGFSDWRLPTVKELRTIVDYGRYKPSINTDYFLNTFPRYWSSTTYVGDTRIAWTLDFDYGNDLFFYSKLGPNFVRAVRGRQTEDQFVDNGDGTVTDRSTGLMWQQATAPGKYTWEQALSYCENLTLAGHSDWRLPLINELESIVDLTRYNPAINTTYFPNTVVFFYWSSTTYPKYTGDARSVGSKEGYVGIDPMLGYEECCYVRAVRARKSGGAGDLDIDGQIDLRDAVLSLQIVVGLSPSTVDIDVKADVDGDKTIELEEAIYILQKAAGLR